ncbi:isopentenyl phosphate kinase [Natranaeroarchaeum sulfidigenes]|uniref:Isopentenyl phosphate kinase n=1 Tax=Natranaeroarchaeum sulfidigenes TaxID=2784880 RepID=A0A897MRD1_9EURY|nr:isopentenyl phosphate kinase [Natranaeroarchaeum sulfidigenes]QSG02568.1 Isopentenyl phosphate kinase, enzyme of modifiedmevalonate pathway [Natranaeroarchaeum sulfidigenes]
MTVVLKLGGSVVTEKDRKETVDGESLDAAAAAIGDAVNDVDGLVVVHGGGSFGHPNAAAYGVSTTEGTHDTEGVLAIHGAMKTLNTFVLRRLREHDVPAVPVHPLSAASRDTGGELTLPVQQVRTLLGEGFVPVLHGDVIAHAGEGVTVVSGDELVVELAQGVDADRVGLCSAVPGVLDENDDVIPRIDAYEDVANVLGASDATDVTGGMAGKVRALLDLDVEASIFDLGSVGPFLAGEPVGTTID